eukprot:177148-Chlamydomonas_euryale.AAC.2
MQQLTSRASLRSNSLASRSKGSEGATPARFWVGGWVCGGGGGGGDDGRPSRWLHARRGPMAPHLCGLVGARVIGWSS